ncbi:MAG: hypothetical protein GX946_02125 [Oligosphaeraceae bacterium]|nr:hypothetical protein [Oligosphaeraceae bacterium]
MESKNILMVEGTDDEHVVKHLCDYHNLGRIDEIKNLGGISELLESLPVQLKGSDVKALGILVDADTNMQARWDSLRDHLVAAGYTAPKTPAPLGTILPPPADALLPKVGIWLMPDNRSNGILEDFLRLLVPTPNELLDHAEHSIDNIPEGHQLFADKDKSKALIHTWLAWQEEPGKPFGTAIKAQYLKANAAKNFINWLKELFFL